ncbi:GUN4 domain-containing protein [Fischerella thermalis]|uniref:GUN4 domain-containing protein n=1 Tax=Fischerella thermalis TaxID=372787 RepID=UPI0019E02A43|nr:GUN4 domain-containing protein [Fischerella thermalis]MBF1989535.1 GUN4 domain-containing protein [Fischerella thermalis M58_A2018_009]MBF2059933.1 GUN4 domain-containing protein [Fischerella thermalis M66_A2018_004]
MTKNWALVIGINQYEFLEPLKYAKQDAQSMQNFLCNEIGFEQVFLFCDRSPKGLEASTHPYRNNLLQFLQVFFEQPCLEPGDNFWFFFSGHGIGHADQDYIMLCDGNPQDVENTALPVNYIFEKLRSCGAGNIILIFDACRDQNKTFGEKFGRQTQQLAHQNGFINIFACSCDEYSYEIDALQQGVFTYALLEGLGNQGQCATLERLNQYLRFRVPQLVHQYKYPRQTPHIVVEPKAKSHLILLPKHATLDDISQLKISASQAEADKNLELAEQLWMQANIMASTPDIDAIAAMQRVAQLRAEFLYSQTNIVLPTPSPEENGRLSLPLPTLEVTNTNNYHKEVNKTTEKFLKRNNISVFNPDFKNNKSNIQDKNLNLCSTLEINYQPLKDLLAASKWKQADRETLTLLLKVAGREKEGWLNIQSINQLPCIDLCTIDQLWLKYSNERFGLSVQKGIWESVGAQGDTDYEIWCKFCDHVGWRVNNNWLFYSDLTFTSDAPQGHFPAAGVIHLLTQWRGWAIGSFSCVVGFSALASKMETCDL